MNCRWSCQHHQRFAAGLVTVPAEHVTDIKKKASSEVNHITIINDNYQIIRAAQMYQYCNHNHFFQNSVSTVPPLL